MSSESWSAVDRHLESVLLPADAALPAALAASDAAGLPAIAVSPLHGRFLALLVRALGARRVLEVGTLGGYSTIAMARALPTGGSIVTCELDPHHAEVARANVAAAGLAERVDVRLGPAAETLAALDREGVAPFDFAFVDADKPSNPIYFEWARRLVRPGGVVVIDNTVREGKILDESGEDAAVVGVRRLHEAIAAVPGAIATALQTVGAKGWDGFTIVHLPGASG